MADAVILSETVHHCLSALADEGFSVVQSTDYQLVVDQLFDLGKAYITPNMSPAVNDFTEENCFWLLLYHGSELVGGLAVRKDALGRERLSSFWPRLMKRQYGGGSRDLIIQVAPSVDCAMGGTLAYFGDLIISPKFRSKGDHLRFFAIYAQMIAQLEWSADWHYSFIQLRRAHLGGAFAFGYMRTMPGAQTWIRPTENRKTHECLVYSSRQEVLDQAAFYNASPDQIAVGQYRRGRVFVPDGANES